MTSERLSAIVDVAMNGTPLDRLITRVKEEAELGYYDDYSTEDVFRKVIKWAEKYKQGDS